MEDVKKKLLELRSKKTGKESIYEKHMDMIIELIKNGARVTEILEVIKTEDEQIANKHQSTAYNLLRQFIASARFQSVLDFHMPKTHLVSKSTTINSGTIDGGSVMIKKAKSKKEDKLIEKNEEVAPVAKQEGEPVVETTREILPENTDSSQTPLNIALSKFARDPQSLTPEEKKLVMRHKTSRRN